MSIKRSSTNIITLSKSLYFGRIVVVNINVAFNFKVFFKYRNLPAF